MSHSTATETILYPLIYPQELFVLENSIIVTKPNSEFKHICCVALNYV